MALLRNLEESLRGLFEGSVGRVFRGEVRPTEIARKLAREMEINKRVSLSRTYAPTDYLVYLSPDDRARYAGVELSIADELGAYLLEHARRERLVLVRRPLVEFRTDPRLHMGEFGIEARTAPISAEEAPDRVDPRAEAPRDPFAGLSGGTAPVSAPGGYDPPAPVAPIDDAPYADPYAGSPFDGPGEATPPFGDEDAEGGGDGDRDAWDREDDPARAGGAPEADWLDPVGDPDPRPAARVPDMSPGPPATGMPWIDPTLARRPGPQLAPPIVAPRPGAPEPAGLTLVVDGAIRVFSGDVVVLGRSRTADVVIADPSVSRRHLELRRDGDGWVASDLGSTNGSAVDGEPVAGPVRISAGSRLSVGHAPAVVEVR